jgi:hypothetical protein
MLPFDLCTGWLKNYPKKAIEWKKIYYPLWQFWAAPEKKDPDWLCDGRL